MFTRVSFFILGSLLVTACQQAPGGLNAITPLAPSSLATQAEERPMLANFVWTATGIQGAGGALSTFNGRCSVPSLFVVSGAFEGEGTHLGRFHGVSSHCAQGPTYGDGIVSITAANGDRLDGTYSGGTSVGGALHDTVAFTGGTGRFDGATGGGDENGVASGNPLTGAPIAFTLDGTIVYAAGRGGY
jgi:hypothetical protein